MDELEEYSLYLMEKVEKQEEYSLSLME